MGTHPIPKKYLDVHTTSHLKTVLWPDFFVGAFFQVLEILQYVCGLKGGAVATSDQNPFFEIACNYCHSNHPFRGLRSAGQDSEIQSEWAVQVEKRVVPAEVREMG